MTTAIIVQARMGSTRLPGKVLAPVMGRPLLAYQLERLQRTRADVIVLATTANPTDDRVAELGRTMGVAVHRGPEDDVLARYIGAAQSVGADTVVRSTADCPLIDPAWIDRLITRFARGDCDHLDFAGLPDGMGAEAIRLEMLEYIWPLATTEEREHVTLHVRRRPRDFRLAAIDTGLDLDDERWTVDTAADLALVRHVIEALWPAPFTLDDIRAALAAHPEWRALNADVPMNPIERAIISDRIVSWSPFRGDL